MLALARLAESRSQGGFTAADVEELFDELTLPPPPRARDALVSLDKKGLVTRRRDGSGWRVTPRGRAESEKSITGIDLAAIIAESSRSGTVVGGAAHPVVLPELGAPPELVPILREFLDAHEFDLNVFGMTRFPNEGSAAPPDPVKGALDAARSACASHGLELHLASDRQLHDDLWTNVAAHMWACRYGIGFFEDLATPKRGLNYNLTTEVGSMMMTGRRCCLLKDPSIKSMPTDIVGRIRKDIDLSDTRAASSAVHAWIRDDLGLGPCGNCPTFNDQPKSTLALSSRRGGHSLHARVLRGGRRQRARPGMDPQRTDP